MTRENVMSTPIFDQLLREMAERAEPPPPAAEPEAKSTPAERPATTTRRRHRAE